MSVSPRRFLFALAIFSAMPLLVACPKKSKPDAGPPPAPPPAEETGPITIAPLDIEDAAADADADAEAGKRGPAVNPNLARLKACCNALSAEAKRLGPSPEAGMFASAAASCHATAASSANGGTPPELGAAKTMLAGRPIPGVCAGL